ncbi:MAG TPA: hypothetical protein VEI97_14100, partial [bacterium]|nr:hypothetical protein [bacterium]
SLYYEAIPPHADDPPGPAPGPFFVALDAMLNGGTLQEAALFSPQGDPVRLVALAAYYRDPEHTQYGTGWRHTVVRSGLQGPHVSLVEVKVERVNPDGSMAAGWLPERRRFRIATGGGPALILDYADESAIFKTPRRGASA